MDARIDVHRVLGLGEGDAHVIRNAGGGATDEAIRSLAISQRRMAFRWGAFTSVEADLRETMAAVRSSPFIPHRAGVRGFVLDLESDRLREPGAEGPERRTAGTRAW
jgi:carbonic anhydrase